MGFLSSIYKTIRPSNISIYKYNDEYSNKPYFFSIPDNIEANEFIKSVLQLPYSLFIETSRSKSQKQLLQNLKTDKLPDILLSITTASCYAGNIVHTLTNIINNRFNMNGSKNLQIETCLQEAIMNSILHGNLGVNSDFRTFKGLYAYQKEIKKRLNIYKYME